MLHDLMVNSNYATLKQTAAERLPWRHKRGISSTCSIAEDYREVANVVLLSCLSDCFCRGFVGGVCVRIDVKLPNRRGRARRPML